MKEKFESQALKCLYRLSRAIAASPGFKDVCGRLLEEAVRVIPVTKASIMKYNEKDGTLQIVASRGIPNAIAKNARVKIGEGISGRVFASSRPLLVKDIRSVRGVRPRTRYRGRSLIAAPVTCVPMKMGGKPVGVINMTDKRDGKPFTPGDLNLLTTISNQIASYLHLCDLAAEVDEAKKTERELEIAREIQQRLLPGAKPHLPGLDVAGRCITSARVGGDYYDFMHDGNVSSLIVADVAGHNVGAALTMASVRSILRAEVASPLVSCAHVVERLNHYLYEDISRSDQFVSMIYAQFLADSRMLRFCIAGHPPPLLYCTQRRAVMPLAGGDGLIGISQDARFSEHRVSLHHGDILLIYTDGLVSARNRRGKPFGTTRLKKSLVRLSSVSAQEIGNIVVSEVQAHCGEPVADDITLVVAKIK